VKSEIVSVRTGFIKKNRYGWDICDDDYWGTGYSRNINDAWLYSDSGMPAKETITKFSFNRHIIHTYETKSGKFGARCLKCHSNHNGKPKKDRETALQSLLSKECSYTVRTIEFL